jgi:hypothetical protein
MEVLEDWPLPKKSLGSLSGVILGRARRVHDLAHDQKSDDLAREAM